MFRDFVCRQIKSEIKEEKKLFGRSIYDVFKIERAISFSAMFSYLKETLASIFAKLGIYFKSYQRNDEKWISHRD